MSAVLEALEPSAKHLSALQPKLVQHFELLGTAIGGVARLRELILTLAVQGKLVPQNPRDDPASELLKKIRAEKDRLIAEGKIKRDKPLASIADDECPFNLPSAWTWARLGQVAKKITDGTHHSPANFPTGDFKYLSAKNIKSWGIDLSDVTYVPTAIHDEIFARCDPELGDILFIKDGATTGVLTINTLDEPFSLLSSVGVIKPSCGISSEWLALVMRSPFFYSSMRAGMTGVAITRVTLSKLAVALTPLPPLAEQSRIVTRVEELMRLCDALEAKGQLEAAQHAQLVQTLLGALTASRSPEELADNWQRVSTHLDLLLDRPEAIDAMEQTLLLLAMRGLLTEQLPSDGKAGDILLNPPDLPEGTKRRRKILRRMRDTGIENDLTDVPPSWEWISIQDLYELNVIVDYADGNHGSLYPRSEEFGPSGVVFVSAKDIVGGCITWETCSKLNEQRAAQLNKGWAKGGDVLLTHNATVGRVALVEGDAVPFLLGTSVTFYRTNACALAPSYLFFFFMSPVWQNQLKGVMEQTTRNQVSIQKQAELLVPLPPLAEQLRIAARVESLRRLCADLRQRLAARQATQTHLAEALIDEVA